MPCRVTSVDGSIVTVAFEVDPNEQLPEVTIPKAESPWIRMPTQVGDYGYTVPADAVLGGISGLGSGVAPLVQPFNLEALVFVPVSNSNSPPIDQNAAQIQGPNGAIIQTTQGTESKAVVNENGISLTYGTTSIVMNSNSITLTVNGNTIVFNNYGVFIEGIKFSTHQHSLVTSGTQDSGPVV